MKHIVIVEVRKLYQLEVEADSPELAYAAASVMQTTDIYEQGDLLTVDTEVIEIEPDEEPI